MAEADEARALELEALVLTYGDDIAIQHDSASIIITLPIHPRLNADCGAQVAYVAATLAISVDELYPEAAPTVSLRDVRGLSDAAETSILQELRSEAQQLQGELILGHLCELALDLLTLHNTPSDMACTICLDPVVTIQKSTDEDIFQMPCYHCFHAKCFIDWLKWQRDHSLDDLTSETSTLSRKGNEPGSKLAGEASILCPTCRAQAPLDGLPASQMAACFEALEARPPTHAGIEGPASMSPRPLLTQILSEQSLQWIRAMQTRFIEGIEIQRQQGGLVRKNVSVSLAELGTRRDASERTRTTSDEVERHAMGQKEQRSEQSSAQGFGGGEVTNPPLKTANGGQGRPSRMRGKSDGMHGYGGRGPKSTADGRGHNKQPPAK